MGTRSAANYGSLHRGPLGLLGVPAPSAQAQAPQVEHNYWAKLKYVSIILLRAAGKEISP